MTDDNRFFFSDDIADWRFSKIKKQRDDYKKANGESKPESKTSKRKDYHKKHG